MKKTNKILATTAAVAAVATAIAPLSNAFAAEAKTPEWNTGSSATINRQIQNAYGTISNTFAYTITASTSNPAGATGAPTAPSIVFNDTYTTQGTATKSATLDFSNMKFERVGDYSYVIAEDSSSNNAIYPKDTTNSYTATVSVRNNSALTGYVASLYVKYANGDKLETISGRGCEFIFTSAPAYTNIQVSHTVSGNAADPDKCFSYTFNVSTSDSYVLDTESTCSNSDTIKNGDTIKLKHQDTAIIGLVRAGSQIPVGTTYSFVRSDSDTTYTTKMDGVEQTSTGTKTMVATGDSTYNTNNKTTINEHLESAVDTNMFMNITIYILLILAGAAGVTYTVRKKLAKKA